MNLPDRPGATSVVLVEGVSDRVAVTTLARRRGHDLAALGVDVVAMGGATNIGRHLSRLADPAVHVAGLCDQAETRFFRRALVRSGRADPTLTDADLPGVGFFVCDRDLEDELIRALGTDAVEAVVEAQGELATFRRFQHQPFQRERPVATQLRRFLGTHSGRKATYAQALVEALDPGMAPPPLDALLGHLLTAEVDGTDLPATP